MSHFNDLDLPSALIDNLNHLGFVEMTPIQQATIPLILQGEDIIAKAQTGSGKTLAFALPLILNLKTKQHAPQALIITPTRELSEQIAQTLRALARYQADIKIVTLYGGTSLTKQVASLEKGADILVGTPGRLLDHLSRESIILHHITTLILDEGDRMLEMGFGEDILKIVSNLPKNRQSLLFSATYPENIKTLASTVLQSPKEVIINTTTKQTNIQERAYRVENKDRGLLTLLQAYQPKLALIFCGTKVKTKELADLLHDKGFDVATLHGDLEQYERQEMLLQFANGSLPVMVATDLAARGLDIEAIDLIINYDLPLKPQEYTHRIGRTGRADASGIAVTLCDDHALRKLPQIRPTLKVEDIDRLKPNKNFLMQGEMITLCIDGGKKKKIRAGDILGTLCQEIGIDATDIGKINLYETNAYVAIRKSVAEQAYRGLKNGKIKKRKLRVWWL